MKTNKRPKYYQLLREAFEASEEVDMLDVDSADDTTLKKLKLLQRQNAYAQLELIRFIIDHQNALKGAMTNKTMH